jgi:osmotically-inducible protein OsmY
MNDGRIVGPAKTRAWKRVAVALVSAMTIAGCTSSTRTTESTGEYVDDAAITSKVKAAILAEPGLKTLQIGVETYKDVVQLSGFVDNAQSKARAGEVAAGVPGVSSVRNNLVVK